MSEIITNAYCNSITEYQRLHTREVNIGGIPVGGNNPVRIQSMTTTDTMDTVGTVEQTIRMVEAGCEYVRITAPSKNEAHNLQNIKDELRKRGYDVPLIADIHFTPNAAEIAARIVEKVRVNPGNYVDKKKFQQIEYTDAEYAEELERIRERFSPLVEICKTEGTAMRIGTNHGSLSDRIMSRYGDTPMGMVESALEFVRICEDLNYKDIILSMKASNTQVMVQAYRLLISRMMEEGRDYPLHLGVTEAGEGEDGRVKSAVGIGALMEDGIGDTIRVSLTEEPEFEAPVAISLADRYKDRAGHEPMLYKADGTSYSPFQYRKRETAQMDIVGGKQVPVVVADLSQHEINLEALASIGYTYDVALDKWHMADQATDYLYVGNQAFTDQLPGGLKVLHDVEAKQWEAWSTSMVLGNKDSFHSSGMLELDVKGIESSIQMINDAAPTALVLTSSNKAWMPSVRNAILYLQEHGVDLPVILKRDSGDENDDELQLYASTDVGGLMIDGLGEGVWLSGHRDIAFRNRLSFNILQASRTRISKTEYISCPSCGRTLFDLQETTAMIRERTSHLKGVKIGIMGCIVNGPGEMADADFGYVGSGPGKITLYKGQEVMQKGIDKEGAVDALIDLIKDNGMWVEKE